jgi:NADH dehydrogenase FAD-containing subunit
VSRHRVVIVGGGFGGIAAAEGLAKAPVDVILIDRTNYHLFQPLLYQVATAHLAPGDIAAPIRQILRDQRNATVLLGEVTGVDVAARSVRFTGDGSEQTSPYDFLIVATGVAPAYFGHDEFAANAPGLKTLADATALRYRTLAAFEAAELENAPERRKELLSFVLVGAGPTGVEMAGALAELAKDTLAPEFRRFDPKTTRIVLLEAGPRILPSFDAGLAESAARRLRAMGVEIRTGQPVEVVDEHGVLVGGERIAAANVFWTAGVRPSPVAVWLAAATDRIGRVPVGPDLSIEGHPEILVIGDVAAYEHDGKVLPGVAQVALQEGRHAAKVIAQRLAGASPLPPFRYRDKGNLAVVGRNFALLERGGWKSSGLVAWFVWAFVHIQFLALFQNRLLVMAQWAWSYLTRQRGSRLILGKR